MDKPNNQPSSAHMAGQQQGGWHSRTMVQHQQPGDSASHRVKLSPAGMPCPKAGPGQASQCRRGCKRKRQLGAQAPLAGLNLQVWQGCLQMHANIVLPERRRGPMHTLIRSMVVLGTAERWGPRPLVSSTHKQRAAPCGGSQWAPTLVSQSVKALLPVSTSLQQMIYPLQRKQQRKCWDGD